MVCSSRASTIRVAWPTYFLGMMKATASAATIVAISASMNALRRARSASKNWLRSISFSLEEGFSHVDDVVGADRLVQPDIGFEPFAVGGGAAQLQPPVAAAGGHAAAGGDRLHDAHVGLDLVGARTRDLAVDVEHRRAIDVHGLAALQREVLAEEPHLLVLAVARNQHRLGPGRQDAARGGDHVGELRAGLVERVASWLRHHAEDRDLAAPHGSEGD